MTNEGITFRQASPADIDQLALVTERANAQRDGNPLPFVASQDVFESVQVRMGRISAHVFAALAGERIVGYALSHPLIEDADVSKNQHPDTEHLAMLMVDPEFWGKQIASRLLLLTTERARSTGKTRLTLWTRKIDNDRARGLYEHRGFNLTGVEKINNEGEQVQYQLVL